MNLPSNELSKMATMHTSLQKTLGVSSALSQLFGACGTSARARLFVERRKSLKRTRWFRGG